MAENTCGTGSKSSFCICQDYNGHLQPEYKFYHQAEQKYICCNDAMLLKTPAAGTTSVVDYLNNVGVFTNCASFYTNIKNGENYDITDKITTDTDLKKFYPNIYYNGLSLGTLGEIFNTNYSVAGDKTVRCTDTTERFYFLKYNSYATEYENYALVCGPTDKTQFQELNSSSFISNTNETIDFSVSTLLDSSGQECTSNTCETKYDPENPNNIGEVIYNQAAANSKTVAHKSLSWIIILVIVIFVLFVFYMIYRYYHEKWYKKSLAHISAVNGKHAAIKADNHAKAAESTHHQHV